MPEKRSTKKQREMLNYVDGFIQSHGYGPSYREIMRALGYKSVSTVAVHLDGLINKGYVRKRDKSARSLEVVSLHLSEEPARTHATPAQEKWLVGIIDSKFSELETAFDQKLLDELYVLIGALKVLGIEGAHTATKSRLADYLKHSN
jgi:repressor LexA